MKRMICLSAVLLAVLLAVSLCGCGDESAAPTGTSVSDEVPSETAAEPLTLPDEITEAPTDELTEAPALPDTEPDTEPETDVPADNEILLGELLDELRPDEGFRARTDGMLRIDVSVFGVVINTELPVVNDLRVGEDGLSLTSSLPLIGEYGVVLTDGTMYLRDSARKRQFDLAPEAETGAGGEQIGPAEPDTPFPFDPDELRQRVGELYDQAVDAVWDIPVRLSDDHRYTVRLSEWASALADGLRDAARRLPSGGDPSGSGEAALPLDPQSLLAWLDTVAADQDAVLELEAGPQAEDAVLTVRLDCPVSVESLLAFAALKPGQGTGAELLPDDISRLLNSAVSDARLSMIFTLGTGTQEILPPEDADAYVPTEWSQLLPAQPGEAETTVETQ